MEDRETARMRKYWESKTTRIMMATVLHVTSGLGLRKFQADGFLLTRVYNPTVCVISGFRTKVDEKCALLDYYPASSSSNSSNLPTFRDNLVPPSNLQDRCCPETSVRNYDYSLRNSPERGSSQSYGLYLGSIQFKLSM